MTAPRDLHDALFGDADADASMVVAGSGAMVRAELQRRGDDPPRLEDVPLFTLGAQGRERALRRLAPPARDAALPLSIVLGARSASGCSRSSSRASATTAARCGRPGWPSPPPAA